MKSNEKGAALLVVIGLIALLTFVLADFTYRSSLNELRLHSAGDRRQARLNAERALNFAMARFKIYRKARNEIEKNESLKKAIPAQLLESLVTSPFTFPIVLPPKANIIQRSALADFEKTSLVQGEFILSVSPIRGFLNPNQLRISSKNSEEEESSSNPQENEEEKASPKKGLEFVEKNLVQALENAIEKRQETDETFAVKYGNVNPQLLVKELKFYVNDQDKFNDAERPEIEANYLAKDIRPKYAPLSSVDELYLLEGWDDTLVELIIDQLNVHETGVIQINEITENQLKLLFPDIGEAQVEAFFTHRDGNPERKIEASPFESVEDFKNVMVQVVGIGESVFQEKQSELKLAGLTFGLAGQLFKVVATGKYIGTSYTINAFVELPARPQIRKVKVKANSEGGLPNEESPLEETSNPSEEEKKDKKPEPLFLLEPRVIEISVE